MFYENVNALCKARNTTITKMSEEIGLSNAAASSWRKGSIPRATTVQKIADYFGVSTDLLLQEDTPTISDIHDSVVPQNNTGNNTVINGGRSDSLTEQECEALRIFRSLDMRKKTAALSYLYDLEDSGK